MNRSEVVMLVAAFCMKPHDDPEHRQNNAKTAKASAEALCSLFATEEDENDKVVSDLRNELYDSQKREEYLRGELTSAQGRIAFLETQVGKLTATHEDSYEPEVKNEEIGDGEEVGDGEEKNG